MENEIQGSDASTAMSDADGGAATGSSSLPDAAAPSESTNNAPDKGKETERLTSAIDKARQSSEQPTDLDAAKPIPWLEELKAKTAAAQTPEPEKPIRPEDFPRSWSDEDTAFWAQLSPEVRAQIANRENDRDAEIRRVQNEAAIPRKEAEQIVEALRGEHQKYVIQKAAIEVANNLEQKYSELWGGIRTEQDIRNLQQQDPARYAQWNEWVRVMESARAARERLIAGHEGAHQQAMQLMNEMQRAHLQEQQRQHAEQVQAEQKALVEWREQQDAEATKRIPDLGKPEKVETLQREALQYLRDIGLQDARIMELWNNSPLRSAEGQVMLHDAMMWRKAQAGAKNAIAKAHAKPLSAGMPMGASTPASELQRAADSGSMENFIRLRNEAEKSRRANGRM